MARVVLTEEARDDLEELIRSHSLPTNTVNRLRRSIELLRAFPRVGSRLQGRWQDYRFVLGPWRWMLLIYRFEKAGDTVIVMRIYDGRSGSSSGVLEDRDDRLVIPKAGAEVDDEVVRALRDADQR